MLFKIENTENNLTIQKVIDEFLSKLLCHQWIDYRAAIKNNYTVHAGCL